jgi:hypothetical protein
MREKWSCPRCQCKSAELTPQPTTHPGRCPFNGDVRRDLCEHETRRVHGRRVGEVVGADVDHVVEVGGLALVQGGDELAAISFVGDMKRVALTEMTLLSMFLQR